MTRGVELDFAVSETSLSGAWLFRLTPARDDRGFFARAWATEVLAACGQNDPWDYSAFAHNQAAGTLRGLHYQVPPHAEVKMVTCVRGSIWDVIVDVRPESETYLEWCSKPCRVSDLVSLLIPAGFAHGYLTLEADTLVSYQVASPYRPAAARGLRWDDPAIGIEWPDRPALVSERDARFPLIGKHPDAD